MILIGSKPYKLKLDNIIDNFQILVRFNMSTSNNNNGKKEPTYQIINCHINEYIRNLNLDEFIKKYVHLVDKEQIILFFNKFKNNYDKLKYISNNGTDLMKNILKQLNINININHQLRAGFGIIAENIINNIGSYLIGYSINKNKLDINEKSYYITQSIVTSHCHNLNVEIEILQELHKKNIIDCSLCLLDNFYELPLLNCQILKPSCAIINLLLKEYGICILENYFSNEIVNKIEQEYDINVI